MKKFHPNVKILFGVITTVITFIVTLWYISEQNLVSSFFSSSAFTFQAVTCFTEPPRLL